MKPQLFFLHFAGGNRYSFKFIQPFLNDFTVHFLELPGRGMRMNEPLIKDFDRAVDDYYAQLMKLVQGQFAVFGHSMGAILMLRLVKRLELAGKKPFQVFVSGNSGPRTMERKERHLFTRQAFKEELTKYGGMPQGVLDDEELYDFFEPVLRADFEVVDGSYDIEQPVIESPMVVLMGTGEQGVEKMESWRSYTTGAVECHSFSGGHFFLYDHAADVAALINSCSKTRLSQ